MTPSVSLALLVILQSQLLQQHGVQAEKSVVLTPQWEVHMNGHPSDSDDWPPPIYWSSKKTREWVAKFAKKNQAEPLIPPFVPLVGDGVVLARSFTDLRAVALKALPGPDAVRVGDYLWMSLEMDDAIEACHIVEDRPLLEHRIQRVDLRREAADVERLLVEGRAYSRPVMLGNSVYVTTSMPILLTRGRKMETTAATFNSANGKLQWIGRESNVDRVAISCPIANQKACLSLIETKDKLRLLQLPDLPIRQSAQEAFATAITQLIFQLGAPENRSAPGTRLPQIGKAISLDPDDKYALLRGFSQMPFVQANDRLIAVTNTGRILALSGNGAELKWAQRYREKEEGPLLPIPKPHWTASMLFLDDGKAIFTAVDAPDIHCFDTRDGKRLWTAKQKNSFFLAGVFAGRAVLLEPKGCRALDVKTGRQVWAQEIGVPSGQGDVSEGLYYQPLKRGLESGRSEIVAITLTDGSVSGRWRVDGHEAPGNLVFHRDLLLSQNLTTLACYPHPRAGEKR